MQLKILQEIIKKKKDKSEFAIITNLEKVIVKFLN